MSGYDETHSRGIQRGIARITGSRAVVDPEGARAVFAHPAQAKVEVAVAIDVAAAMAQQNGLRPMLSFIRTEESGGAGVSVPVITELDGSFEVSVPKGKYRISVRFPYTGPEDQKLLNEFDQRNSPIVREVIGDGQEINVDLSNPNGP